LDVLLAVSPVGAALLFLLGLRRTALTAGAVGCLLALLLTLLYPPYLLPPDRLVLALLRGVLVASIVAYVVFFGLLLYHLMAGAGAIKRIAAALAGLPGDPPARALLLCLPIGAFLEAVSGFGVSIVVVAPLLAGIGFAPERAALLSLFTQNAVPWGALAIGVVLSGEIAGLPVQAIGVGCAYLSALIFPYLALLVLWIAGGRAAVRANVGFALALAAVMAVGVGLATVGFGVELGMVTAGPVAIGCGLVWLVRRRSAVGAIRVAECAPSPPGRPHPDPLPEGEGTQNRHPGDFGGDVGPSLAAAVAPYGVLVLLLLVSRLFSPLQHWLQEHAVVSVPSLAFALPLLYSPGFMLMLAGVAAIPILRVDRTELTAALGRTSRQWLRATGALVAFTVLSELMLRAGMTDRLASAAAAGLGGAYVLAAPALGAMSGFLTGSNAAGAAMLLPFQLRVADELGLPRLVIAAAQNAAASAASLASPQRVVLAGTVLALGRAEGGLVRTALLVEVGAVLLITLGEVVWLGLAG
jgi:lactate permease